MEIMYNKKKKDMTALPKTANTKQDCFQKLFEVRENEDSSLGGGFQKRWHINYEKGMEESFNSGRRREKEMQTCFKYKHTIRKNGFLEVTLFILQ